MPSVIYDRWHSHGAGISMKILQDELKLEVSDLDGDPDRCTRARQYYDLFSDYILRRGFTGVIHTVGKFTHYLHA